MSVLVFLEQRNGQIRPVSREALGEATRLAAKLGGPVVGVCPAAADELLARAKSQGKGALGSAQGFTEKVQKGRETLYRARFAGLEEDQAEAACKSLKRSGFACFTTKN